MAVTRRTFLRVLGSVIVGVVMTPALPPQVLGPPLPCDSPFFRLLKAGGAMDRLAVRSMARRQTLARETGLVYDVELAA